MAICYVGIDPGLHGGVGIVDPEGNFRAGFDLPIIRDMSIAWVDAPKFIELVRTGLAGDQAQFFIERVSAMPKQGVTSSFQFGVGFGSVLALAQSFGYPMQLVTARKWKDMCKVTKDKGTSLDRARMMFPKADLRLKKHENRAEALLIAYYGMMMGMRGMAA